MRIGAVGPAVQIRLTKSFANSNYQSTLQMTSPLTSTAPLSLTQPAAAPLLFSPDLPLWPADAVDPDAFSRPALAKTSSTRPQLFPPSLLAYPLCFFFFFLHDLSSLLFCKKNKSQFLSWISRCLMMRVGFGGVERRKPVQQAHMRFFWCCYYRPVGRYPVRASCSNAIRRRKKECSSELISS